MQVSDFRKVSQGDISPELSLWLDLLRSAAAVVVVLGHAGNIRFTDGDLSWVRDWTLAPDAVIVFFLVSGLVIGRAATRDATWGRYAFSRLTRLWSVVLPALVVTLLLDAAGRAIDPGAYGPLQYEELPIAEFLLRGITFSQEWRGLGAPVQLGSNVPLWSLSFEAAYYLLFGIAMFMRGWIRVVALTGLALVFGLAIMLLLPTWLAGYLVWQLIRTGYAPSSLLVAIPLPLVPILILVFAKLAGLDHTLLRLTPDWLAPSRHPTAFNFAREVFWNSVMAAALFLHLLGMNRVGPRFSPALSRAIRWFAGASFSIYVMHYPIMHLMDATLPEFMPAKSLLFVALPIAICLLFAEVFERPLPKIRKSVAGKLIGERR